MPKYLGETDITEEHGEINPTEMSLHYIMMYGGIDGSHHKNWLLDQIARILHGCPVTVKRASWDNGETELRYSVGENDEYLKWVKSVKDGEDGPDTYDYDQGTPP